MTCTVDLDPALLDRAERLALSEGKTLSSILSEALAAYLGDRKQAANDPPFELIVRGSPRARSPSAAEVAALEDKEELASLPGAKRRASP